MNNMSEKGGITSTAWLVSLVLHFIILAVLGGVRLCEPTGSDAMGGMPGVFLDRVDKIAGRPQITPVPKVKKVSLLEGGSSAKVPPELSFTAASVLSSNADSSAEKRTGAFVPGKAPAVGRPGAEFFSSPALLRKICYVVDCSGSMFGRFRQVQERLKSSIRSLQPDQYFYIIFFLDGDRLIESGQGRMSRATSSAKKTACDFVDKAGPAGATNALNAIRRAMEIRDADGNGPELIFFLTDGFDLNGRAGSDLADSIENSRKLLAPSAVINTIGFKAMPQDCRVLQSMAAKTGGQFTAVE